MAFAPPNTIPLWPAFFPSAPVVPKLYYDALSPEQRIKKLCEELHRLCEYANVLGKNINIDHQLITELQEAFTQFMESGFDDYYKAQIEQWINDNFIEVVRGLLNQGVWFGLTDDGYFCANSTWQLLIEFDTDADPESETYGHLILRY